MEHSKGNTEHYAKFKGTLINGFIRYVGIYSNTEDPKNRLQGVNINDIYVNRYNSLVDRHNNKIKDIVEVKGRLNSAKAVLKDMTGEKTLTTNNLIIIPTNMQHITSIPEHKIAELSSIRVTETRFIVQGFEILPYRDDDAVLIVEDDDSILSGDYWIARERLEKLDITFVGTLDECIASLEQKCKDVIKNADAELQGLTTDIKSYQESANNIIN